MPRVSPWGSRHASHPCGPVKVNPTGVPPWCTPMTGISQHMESLHPLTFPAVVVHPCGGLACCLPYLHPCNCTPRPRGASCPPITMYPCRDPPVPTIPVGTPLSLPGDLQLPLTLYRQTRGTFLYPTPPQGHHCGAWCTQGTPGRPWVSPRLAQAGQGGQPGPHCPQVLPWLWYPGGDGTTWGGLWGPRCPQERKGGLGWPHCSQQPRGALPHSQQM